MGQTVSEVALEILMGLAHTGAQEASNRRAHRTAKKPGHARKRGTRKLKNAKREKRQMSARHPRVGAARVPLRSLPRKHVASELRAESICSKIKNEKSKQQIENIKNKRRPASSTRPQTTLLRWVIAKIFF